MGNGDGHGATNSKNNRSTNSEVRTSDEHIERAKAREVVGSTGVYERIQTGLDCSDSGDRDEWVVVLQTGGESDTATHEKGQRE